MLQNHSKINIAIIGGGPAGLMAAQAAADAGAKDIHVLDAMPSVGRKFLLAGIGGLNLTHSEPHAAFMQRFGAELDRLQPALDAFDATALRAWCKGLGIDTFVGSSGRVFPLEMKAAPLLRAWLARLRVAGVQFHSRHRWMGWGDGNLDTLIFSTPQGETRLQASKIVLALGGGSWRKLGSDGAWVALLRERGVAVKELKPSNCGFDVAWSDVFQTRCAGMALKNIAIQGRVGECVLTRTGIEGSLVYAHSAAWRDAIASKGSHTIYLDLAPHQTQAQLADKLSQPRGARSWAGHVQNRLGFAGGFGGGFATLLRECLGAGVTQLSPAVLAAGMKALPITLRATRPIDEAISSAGGVAWGELSANYELKALPNTFCAGEMLDWEAPTGGYLLNGCLATGAWAGRAAGLCIDS